VLLAVAATVAVVAVVAFVAVDLELEVM